MGLRFRKSVKIAPGVRATVGKKSASVSVGATGARHTISTTGKKTTTVGVPGSGLSHVSTSSAKQGKGSGAPVRYSPRTYKVSGVLLLILRSSCKKLLHRRIYSMICNRQIPINRILFIYQGCL